MFIRQFIKYTLKMNAIIKLHILLVNKREEKAFILFSIKLVSGFRRNGGSNFFIIFNDNIFLINNLKNKK